MTTEEGIGRITATVKSWTFEWEINDFFSYTEEDLRLLSPDFVVLDSKWVIAIRPNGVIEDKCTEYISLYLKKRDKIPTTVEFKFGIKTVNKTIDCEKVFTHSVDNDGWGQSKFLYRSILQQRKAELVPSGVLTITCSLAMKNTQCDLDSSCEKLADDIKGLFTSQSNTDISLNVKGKVFPAHKTILEARSPVFAAMFKNDMVEKQTGEVNIPDCEPDVFDVFLFFLYSGEKKFSECNVFDLYKVSDKYNVRELKLKCLDFMAKTLSVENFGEILILADTFEEEGLFTHVQDFFNDNLEKIFSSDSWEKLFKENFRLANSLLKSMAPKITIKK